VKLTAGQRSLFVLAEFSHPAFAFLLAVLARSFYRRNFPTEVDLAPAGLGLSISSVHFEVSAYPYLSQLDPCAAVALVIFALH
jgi:hypothetical protein